MKQSDYKCVDVGTHALKEQMYANIGYHVQQVTRNVLLKNLLQIRIETKQCILTLTRDTWSHLSH